MEMIKEYSERDPDFQQVKEAIQQNKWFDNVPSAYVKVKDELMVTNGLLLRQQRLVIPQGLRKRCLDLVHKNHMGIVRCKEHLRSKVWWPSMDKAVERYISECKACQVVGKDGNPEPLRIHSLPDRPWQVIHMDVCGPFPNGDSLFTMMDSYSRFPEVVIIKCTKAKTLIKHMRSIFARLGFPEKVVTDNGSNFKSDEMKVFFQQCGIGHRKVVPYSPQSNGLIERFHRTIKKMIQTVNSEGRMWQDNLNSFLMDYRSTVHASTNKTPAMLLFGREIKTDIPAIYKKLRDQEVRSKDWKSKQTMKRHFDQNSRAVKSTLHVGDIVLLKQSRENKLSTRFENQTYKIIEKKGNKATICSKSGDIKVRNTREIKKFFYAEEKKQKQKKKKKREVEEVEDIYPSTMDMLDDIEIQETESRPADRNEAVVVGEGEVEATREVEREVEVTREEAEVSEGSAAGAQERQVRRGLREKRKPAHLRDFVLSQNK